MGYVSEFLLKCLEDTFIKFEMEIIDDIGRNILDKNDYIDIKNRYTKDDLLTKVINMIKRETLYDIARNYCDIPYEVLVKEFIK